MPVRTFLSLSYFGKSIDVANIQYPKSIVFARQNRFYWFLACHLLFCARLIIANTGTALKKEPISKITENSETEKTMPRKFSVRISLLGGYQKTLGNLRNILPEGIEARLAFDLPLGRGAWPALRLETGYAGFGGLQGTEVYSLTGMALGAGPVWFLHPFRNHRGQIIAGVLVGALFARLQGPTAESQASLLAGTALIGYEYPLGPVQVFLQSRCGYITDQNNPLISGGGAIGIARPLFDN